ncbi:hypothetical protein BD410DRAFT_790288 [Rickenella mellea]|uniref:SigF-like NTF2-like domain-containing protein n=1 Tax=Rickenella mellea TaxID=50990 RepID=A0A4Y7Q0L0_9AGAM|nr:hypothetical protein BD410DRAFT_790288 [Rickenella mellea]
MEDPQREISQVVKMLTTAVKPDIQQQALERFFVSNAGFNHPLCAVQPGPESRKRILAIYQWYRNLSPHITLEVDSVVYDAEKYKMYLDITQQFHLFISPFKPSPAH